MISSHFVKTETLDSSLSYFTSDLLGNPVDCLQNRLRVRPFLITLKHSTVGTNIIFHLDYCSSFLISIPIHLTVHSPQREDFKDLCDLPLLPIWPLLVLSPSPLHPYRPYFSLNIISWGFCPHYFLCIHTPVDLFPILHLLREAYRGHSVKNGNIWGHPGGSVT